MSDSILPHSWTGIAKPGATDHTMTGYFYDANGNRVHFTGLRMPNGEWEFHGITDTQN